MKTRSFPRVMCLAALVLGAGIFRASAEFEVSVGVSVNAVADFYEPLTPRGAWIEVGHYGRCWRPARVASGWRPYCNGYWEWTDCGWYWVSDEPWAWACYHYGTWAFDPGYGWVWIPGVEWAPAWVYWRTGGNYTGWAPCGPSGFVVEPSVYVFVENRHFHDHFRPNTVIVNNTTIINQTTEIRNVQREQKQINGRSQTVVVNSGPDVATVAKATGHKYRAASVQKVDQPTTRSIPEKLRHRTEQPVRDEQKHLGQPNPQTQQPVPQHKEVPRSEVQQPTEKPRPNSQRHVDELPKTTPGGNQEIPHDLKPKKEIPAENNSPHQKTLPKPEPERIMPRVPPEQVVPKEPKERGEPRPKEIIPPVHPEHPQAPVGPPGGPGPNDKGQERDHNQ